MTATYDQWNRAITAFFVEGTPPGEPVFLSADDATLALIGRQQLGDAASPAGALVEQFQSAVRDRVCADGSVQLAAVSGDRATGEPACAAFLAAMVVAASHMGESAEVDDLNYFVRLREVLGLPGTGRPPGLALQGRGNAPEEALWRHWNF